jgi:hypothetical protein
MDSLEINKPGNILIVAFGGYDQKVGQMRPFEFLNFLNRRFPETSKLFLKDSYSSNYHKGVKGISTNIETTKRYLQEKIKNKCVLFLGSSGGGYASILFGSLLNVNYVLAFIPQTILRKDDKDPFYKDLAPFINKTTRYYLYGNSSVEDPMDPHHISHCERINNHENVNLSLSNIFNLKIMRDSGDLFKIIQDILQSGSL